MRIKKLIVLLGLAGLVAVSILIIGKWRHPPPASHLQPAQDEATPVSNQPTNDQRAVAAPPQDGNLTPRAAGLTDGAWAYLTKLHQMSISQNGPLEFHGRVLDQNNNPVVGARVTTKHIWYDSAWIRRAYPKPPVVNQVGGVPTMTETNVLVTGTDGSFHLTRDEATGLHIQTLEKEGYEWDRKSGGESFTYDSRFIIRDPDRWPAYMKTNGGFVVRVWKKGQPEKLVQWSKTIRLARDMKRYSINLFGLAELGASADVVVENELVHPELPVSEEYPRAFDRWIRIKPINGQIQLTQDVYPYHAPSKEPYEAQFQFLYQVNGRESEGWRKNFYVKGRNGRCYASLQVRFVQSPMSLQIDAVVNPSNSTNLEPDPEKLITDPEEIRRLDEQTRVAK